MMHELAALCRHVLDTILPPHPLERAAQVCTKADLSARLALSEYKGILILFPYTDPLIKHLIWSLKYRGSRKAAVLFADMLHEALLEEMAEKHMFGERAALLIPVPLSKKRRRERGHNHMELVSARLANRLPEVIHAPHALTKKRDTAPQTSLPKEKRLTNLSGAFAVSDERAVFGKHTLMLDDVTTTGSTLFEAKKTLLAAGARSVQCVAIAH